MKGGEAGQVGVTWIWLDHFLDQAKSYVGEPCKIEEPFFLFYASWQQPSRTEKHLQPKI